MVPVPSQRAPRCLDHVGPWLACMRHHSAPLQDVFDPDMVTFLQYRHVVCSVATIVVLLLLLFVPEFGFSQIVHVSPAWFKLGWDDRDRRSDFSPHEELGWTVSIGKRSSAVGHESKVRIPRFL